MSKQTTVKNDKPTTPKTANQRRRIRFAALVPAALSAAVLVGALAYSKKPPLQGD